MVLKIRFVCFWVDIQIYKAGFVGLLLDDNLRAAYVLLEFESNQCEVTIHRIT